MSSGNLYIITATIKGYYKIPVGGGSGAMDVKPVYRQILSGNIESQKIWYLSMK